MKKSGLNITRIGLSVSAILSVPYVLLMIASLVLVGVGTTGSRQAFFLGIKWSTIVGLEFGLVVIVLASFGITAVLTQIYNAFHHLPANKPITRAQNNNHDQLTVNSWQVRMLFTCLVLPALALLSLRIMAATGIFRTKTSDAGTTRQSPGSAMRPISMGPVINTAHRETEPSFTADGITMYFNCNSGDICVSRLTGTWVEGNWTPPERIGSPISTDYEEIEPVINATGDKLYFTSRRPGNNLWRIPILSPFLDLTRVVNTLSISMLGRSFWGGLGLSDIYVSYRINGAWSEPQNLNEVAGEPPINSGFSDHCLFFSADGKEAFWTSTRPGGFGSDDIWTSQLVDGKWTEPENLGSNVNGPESEHAPTPAPDGQALYITATRPEGFGKEDIYITKRAANGEWGFLVNLGPLVNGPGDDRCPAWTPDLKTFLFDSLREGGYGARDIWWVNSKDIEGYPLIARPDISPIEGE